MLLRLYLAFTHLRLLAGGARRVRCRLSAWEIVCWTLGPRTGAPWLLLHGLGATALAWARVARSLAAAQHRVVIPELSRLGGSRGPTAAIRVADAPAILRELIDDRSLGQPLTVAGMSLGGWMAVRLAIEHPEQVSRLILIDCAGWRHQDWDTVRRSVTVESLEDVDRLYGKLFRRPPLLMRVSRRGFLKAYRSPAVREILESTREEDAFGVPELQRVTQPTGLVWGTEDGLFPLTVGRAMLAAIPRAELLAIEGCGHAVHWECADRLAKALRVLDRSLPTTAAPARETGSAPGPRTQLR